MSYTTPLACSSAQPTRTCLAGIACPDRAPVRRASPPPSTAPRARPGTFTTTATATRRRVLSAPFHLTVSRAARAPQVATRARDRRQPAPRAHHAATFTTNSATMGPVPTDPFWSEATRALLARLRAHRAHRPLRPALPATATRTCTTRPVSARVPRARRWLDWPASSATRPAKRAPPPRPTARRALVAATSAVARASLHAPPTRSSVVRSVRPVPRSAPPVLARPRPAQLVPMAWSRTARPA